MYKKKVEIYDFFSEINFLLIFPENRNANFFTQLVYVL